MPTRQSTHHRLLDDATMIALEVQDDLVHAFRDAEAAGKSIENVRRHIRQAVTANAALRQVFDQLGELTLVAERGRAQGDQACRDLGMAV